MVIVKKVKKEILKNFDYNLLISNGVNTKEDFESLNGCFLGNYTYLEKYELIKVKIAKIIDMF